ncbi:MAG: HD domain-containing phosphohydrolase [Pseudoxanthomonas sp.]
MTQIYDDVRISVQGLAVGMFVSRLDRPWLETPFPLEGVMLKTAAEVDRLQRTCSYVYIDTTRGIRPDVRFIEYSHATLVNEIKAKEEVAALRKVQWTITNDFESELKIAGEAHGILEVGIREVMDDLQEGNHLDLAKLTDGVEAMIESIIRNPSAFTWLQQMKRWDSYSYHHALGCAILASSFGRHLGLEKKDLNILAMGGMLCDVGKVRLTAELLAKHSSLSAADISLVRRHVAHGVEIVEGTTGISPKVVEIVASHHERHNGSGYPNGLKGSEIPIFGRIVGLVDSYDAMTSVRTYAKIRSPHMAVTELYESRGMLFQAELVEQFIQTCGIFPIGTLVELSSGEVGVITAVHSLKRLRPSVMLLLDSEKNPLQGFRTLDMSLVELDQNGDPLSVKSGLPTGAFGLNTQELFLD